MQPISVYDSLIAGWARIHVEGLVAGGVNLTSEVLPRCAGLVMWLCEILPRLEMSPQHEAVVAVWTVPRTLSVKREEMIFFIIFF